MLGSCGLNKNARIICEKPFGVDLASAQELNRVITANFDETQVFRIDHFLGKESIDNILALRFANRMFEPLWNRDHVCFVQIDVPEVLSIEHRGPFYERPEPSAHGGQPSLPVWASSPWTAHQPGAGPRATRSTKSSRRFVPSIQARHSRPYYGYLKENRGRARFADRDLVALRAEVENTRWKGVPFYLRTGKCMAQSRQVITIGFDEPVMRLFPRAITAPNWRGNKLVVELRRSRSIHAHFMTKEPGPQMLLEPARR